MYTSTKIHATCIFTINTNTMIILILMIILITDMLQHDLALLTVCCSAFKTISQSSVPFTHKDNIHAPPCIHTHKHKSAPIQVLSLSLSLSLSHTHTHTSTHTCSLSLSLTCPYITVLVDWDKTPSYLP